MKKRNIFQNFSNHILGFPLWIKQIVFLKLKEDLETSLSKDLNIINKNDLFQLYSPVISFKGKKELETREHEFSQNVYTFLNSVLRNLTIIEITINNFWTLEEIAAIFNECLNKELIVLPDSNKVVATASFLAGKLRVGEYFKKIGKLNIDQLETALRKQKETEQSTGDKMGLATVLIHLGYISNNDPKALLLIKEESKKRFIFDLDIGSYDASAQSDDDPLAVQKKIQKLEKENKILKNQLRKILNIKK